MNASAKLNILPKECPKGAFLVVSTACLPREYEAYIVVESCPSPWWKTSGEDKENDDHWMVLRNIDGYVKEEVLSREWLSWNFVEMIAPPICDT